MNAPASPLPRWPAAVGGLFASAGVALAAWAAHGADGSDAARLQSASLMLLLHGIALAALRPQLGARRRAIVAAVLLFGCLLFAGSLVGAVAFGWPTRLAPFGGTLLIVGWLGWAGLALQRDS